MQGKPDPSQSGKSGVIGLLLKGAAMGAANVIPGVSGGTMAFITGIYERLLLAVKSVDREALGLLLKGRIGAFLKRIDGGFLFFVGAGVVAGILSLAQLLGWLFEIAPVPVFAFFFGLILASIFSVGREVSRWQFSTILAFLIGLGIAASLTQLEPAEESTNLFYLLLCGAVSMASMIIPGLSGSFVLLLMGNYQLIMIQSVNGLMKGDLEALQILVPVGIGALIGLVALSRLLTWIFRVFRDVAVALLTGFVAGSLAIIWPWKDSITTTFTKPDGEEKVKVIGYEWFLPELSTATLIAVVCLIAGAMIVFGTEWWAKRNRAVSEETHGA